MKILILGDCHGDTVEIGSEEDYDLVLSVGDVCGTPDELREAGIEARGSDKEWHEILGEEKSKEVLQQSINQGHEVLQWLNSLAAPVFMVPGNADWTGELTEWEQLGGNKYEEMLAEYENISDLNFSRKSFGDYEFIGYGPCPGPEKEQEYSQNMEKLEHLFDNNSRKTVFLSHNVPSDTPLDETNSGEHYGSKVVRSAVENYKPILSAAGHIHEGEGKYELDGVKCLNAGLNSYTIVEIEGNKIMLDVN